jgi:hypothetical protein
MEKSKFDPFDRLDLAFASVNGHALEASILTPKTLQEKASGTYPVLVYWHGGGFIVGHRLYEPWWSNWQVWNPSTELCPFFFVSLATRLATI